MVNRHGLVRSWTVRLVEAVSRRDLDGNRGPSRRLINIAQTPRGCEI